MIPGALQSPGRSAGGTVYIVSETFLRYTTDYRYISAQNGRIHRARAMLPKFFGAQAE